MIQIIKSTAAEINIDPKEVAVYLGYYSANSVSDKLIAECIEEYKKAVSYKACIKKIRVCSENCVDLGFIKTESSSLKKNLCGCEYAYIMAATTGFDAQRLIERNAIISPLKGMVTDCVGSAAIEAFCDEINLSLENTDFLRPRFSPGYGDMAIDYQKDIVAFLDTKKNIGLTLTDSLMMTPVKSVTAIIGIGKEKNKCTGPGCMICRKNDCPYR